MAQNDQRLKQVESQLTSIQSLLLQRGTFPLQPKPNPKKEGANVVKGRNNSYNQWGTFIRSNRIQEDFEETEGSSPKATKVKRRKY